MKNERETRENGSAEKAAVIHIAGVNGFQVICMGSIMYELKEFRIRNLQRRINLNMQKRKGGGANNSQMI